MCVYTYIHVWKHTCTSGRRKIGWTDLHGQMLTTKISGHAGQPKESIWLIVARAVRVSFRWETASLSCFRDSGQFKLVFFVLKVHGRGHAYSTCNFYPRLKASGRLWCRQLCAFVFNSCATIHGRIYIFPSTRGTKSFGFTQSESSDLSYLCAPCQDLAFSIARANFYRDLATKFRAIDSEKPYGSLVRFVPQK